MPNTPAQVSPVSDATRNSSVLLEAQRLKIASERVETAVPRTPGAEPGTVKNFLKLFQGAGKVPCPQPNTQGRSTQPRKESEAVSLNKSWKSEVSTQSGEPTAAVAGNKSVLSRYQPQSDKSFTSPTRDIGLPATAPSWAKQSSEDQ